MKGLDFVRSEEQSPINKVKALFGVICSIAGYTQEADLGDKIDKLSAEKLEEFYDSLRVINNLLTVESSSEFRKQLLGVFIEAYLGGKEDSV